MHTAKHTQLLLFPSFATRPLPVPSTLATTSTHLSQPGDVGGQGVRGGIGQVGSTVRWEDDFSEQDLVAVDLSDDSL